MARPVGRPRATEESRRSRQLGVRVTAREAAAIAAAAEHVGEASSSTWARDVLLAAAGHGPPAPSADAREVAAAVDRLAAQVRRLGVNLNGIARRVNAADVADVAEVLADSDVPPTIIATRDVLTRVLQRLEDLAPDLRRARS